MRLWFCGKHTDRRREDDEARPVVLDELAHDELCVCIPPTAVPSLQSLI